MFVYVCMTVLWTPGIKRLKLSIYSANLYLFKANKQIIKTLEKGVNYVQN